MQPRKQKQEVKITFAKANVLKLKPGRKYILAFDSTKFSREDAARVAEALDLMGIDALTIHLIDPNNSMNVIEVKPKGSKGD